MYIESLINSIEKKFYKAEARSNSCLISGILNLISQGDLIIVIAIKLQDYERKI